METDREQLRTIYNQKFKTRYGPAHSPAQNRGPSSPPRPPRRGHPARPSAEGRSSRSGPDRSRGGADVPSRAVPTPLPRLPEPARPLCSSRAPAPSPRGEPPAQPARPAPGSGWGPAALAAGRGEGTALGGGGARWVGVPASRKRGEGASWWWRRAQARAARVPRPLVEGLLLQGSTIPESWSPSVGGRISGSKERRKGTNYLRAIPPLPPVASPRRPRARPVPRGAPSTLWLKAAWALFPATIQVKIKETSL